MPAAITVEDLSKAYRIGAKEEVPDTLTGALTNLVRAPLKNFSKLKNLSSIRANEQDEDILWALRGVSFEIDKGDVVGIIGRNGAGKSTLLKILSRITEPTGGRAVIRGRVSSLLEVGTGFHPELTGRENVYMNGTILGMTKREIDRKFDEIVDFSGVEKFLDTPSKRYSSGMQVRLAFAVAAHLEPEILIIDEVLAVGDAEFQKKCLGKMRDVASEGRTVLFVSHNMPAIERLCEHAFLLQTGHCSDKMGATEAVSKYLHVGEVQNTEVRNLERSLSNTPSPLLTEFSITCDGVETEAVSVGARVVFGLTLENIENFSDVACSITLNSMMGERIVMFHTKCHSALRLPPGKGVHLTCLVPNLNLNCGEYSVEVGVADNAEGMLERIDSVKQLVVRQRDLFRTGSLLRSHQGVVVMPANWEVTETSS